jgi:hypothetical protein
MGMKDWNIWNIRSKTLRAIVAWLFAALVAVVVLVALPVALVWLAAAGIWGGMHYLVPFLRDDVATPLWRAATGRESV